MNKITSFIVTNYKKHTTPTINHPEKGLAFWREKVVLEVIYILFVTAVIAYIPSVILSIREGFWIIAIVDTLFYVVLFYLFFNKKLSVKFRAFSILTLSYFLGVILVLAVGPSGAGYLWLFVLPILAGILIEKKTAVNLVIINFVTLVFLGVVQYYLSTPFSQYNSFSVASWVVISANFIFLNIIITFSVIVLIRGLKQALEKEKVMTASLEKHYREIRAAKEEAEKADKVKSEFLAQMSHEIRTPINTILGFTSLIKDMVGDNSNEEVKESFNLISAASNRIIRTIDLILNMSEIQAESFKPVKRNIDLYNDVLHPLVNEYRRAVKTKGLELYLENKLENKTVYADEYTVNQIFANLLDNAIKYTDRGEIKISLFHEDGESVVTVEDTGIGISEKYLTNIFTPFSQEDKGYTRKYDGNGLGLSLVKKYCEINNTGINVESKKSIGTKVTVSFRSEKEIREGTL